MKFWIWEVFDVSRFYSERAAVRFPCGFLSGKLYYA